MMPSAPTPSPAVDPLADRIERYFSAENVELTMGGEPTFVPRVTEGAEWNNAAMGPEKLTYARRMSTQLLRSTYPGGVLMQVFGKHYPGEPLPRWNCLLLHRPDAAPLWKNAAQFDLASTAPDINAQTAAAFAKNLATTLGFEKNLIRARFPATSKRGSAWVLPLDHSEGGWISDDWSASFPKGIKILPGDSPAGLLLPLIDLPEAALRRALTVEREDGQLNIFVPPLPWPGFAALLATIEQLATRYQLPKVILTGYAPYEREEHGVTTYGMAADPGVLEVNLPPTSNWTAYRDILEASYEAAQAVGLYGTKCSLNGAIRGSGGGSHLAFGGPDLPRNPFLQTPARIASLLRYWQHHPALSYAFTGQFVGPGCQAPRVDEGPLHGLYELEVACEGLDQLTQVDNGYYIDQALRNLLTDSSGNTHRAELCFDKFHNALSPNGLLGIVELRAFESLPDGRDLALVGLFIRCIIARLFKAPFREPLHRFGPDLHDRYFLPSYLEADLRAITADLQAHGFPFEFDWLRPVLDFRCPQLGTLSLPKGELRLRQALESFPLMAEESLSANTVRMVDNSTDRIEIELSDPSRLKTHQLSVNGIIVPFHEFEGKAIAGLRYKCASAYPALHPHVGIQSPLRFEWIEKKSEKVTAAAHYHYWNPDSAIYDSSPADEADAQERARRRWRAAPELIGNTATSRPAKQSTEYTRTLDLRRNA